MSRDPVFDVMPGLMMILATLAIVGVIATAAVGAFLDRNQCVESAGPRSGARSITCRPGATLVVEDELYRCTCPKPSIEEEAP